MRKDKKITFRIDPELSQRINELREEFKLPTGKIIRAAVVKFIADFEAKKRSL